MGEDQGIIWNAKQLILDQFDVELDRIFRKQRYDSAVAYFEFYGPFSFAGSHNELDKHEVTLIDIAPYKRGILLPRDFLKLFTDLKTPPVLFTGQITSELIDQIKDSTLEGMTHEGVVCKGVHKGKICMYKVKTRKWLNELREYCGDDVQLYKRLL